MWVIASNKTEGRGVKSTKGRRERIDACGADFCSTFCLVLRDSRTIERGGEGGRTRKRRKRRGSCAFFRFLSLACAPFATKEKKNRKGSRHCFSGVEGRRYKYQMLCSMRGLNWQVLFIVCCWEMLTVVITTSASLQT